MMTSVRGHHVNSSIGLLFGLGIVAVISYLIFSHTIERDRHKILSITIEPPVVKSCDPITVVYRTWRTEKSNSTTTRHFFRLPDLVQVWSITQIGSYNEKTGPEGKVVRNNVDVPCFPPGKYRVFTTIVDRFTDGKTEIVSGPPNDFAVIARD